MTTPRYQIDFTVNFEDKRDQRVWLKVALADVVGGQYHLSEDVISVTVNHKADAEGIADSLVALIAVCHQDMDLTYTIKEV